MRKAWPLRRANGIRPLAMRKLGRRPWGGLGRQLRCWRHAAGKTVGLLTEIRVPEAGGRKPGWGFQKFTKRGIDWANWASTVQGRSVGLVNMGPAPLRPGPPRRLYAGGAGAAGRGRPGRRRRQPAR